MPARPRGPVILAGTAATAVYWFRVWSYPGMERAIANNVPTEVVRYFPEITRFKPGRRLKSMIMASEGCSLSSRTPLR